MAGYLIDTNIWIAASFVTHPFNQKARRVLTEATPTAPAIFCRTTQQGFLRLACNPILLKAYGAEGLTNRDALVALKAFLQLPQVSERDEPPGVVPLWHRLAVRDSASPKLWMDAYLAAFAICAGLCLITLDRDFRPFEVHGLCCECLAG